MPAHRTEVKLSQRKRPGRTPAYVRTDVRLLIRASLAIGLLLALLLSTDVIQAPAPATPAAARAVQTTSQATAAPPAQPAAPETTPTSAPAPPAPTATPHPANTASIPEGAAGHAAEVAATSPPPPLQHRFTPREGDIVTRVERGVYHIRRVTDDPLRINVLLFDLTAPEFDLQTALGDDWLSGRTRTTYMVRQNDALAGINGDLFAGRGAPQGLTMIDSRVAMPPKHRATFAWSPEKGPFIGYFTDSWSWHAEAIAANGERMVIAEFNRPCFSSSLCLYNEFYRAVTVDWRTIKVLIGPSGRVFDIVEGEAMYVDDGMRVLQGIGDGAEWIVENVEIGDELRFEYTTTNPLDDYTQAISGGPIILEEGRFKQDCLCKLYDCSEVVIAPGEAELYEDILCEDFDTYWKERHYEWVYMPRTGIGFDKEQHTLIVAVVDGYQLGYSRGVLQREFADLFIEFGAYNAMEFDGGGSSTMVLNDEIMNQPSDETGERYVANALLFFWHDYTPDLRYPQQPDWREPALRPQ
jgi:hypothetical protein